MQHLLTFVFFSVVFVIFAVVWWEATLDVNVEPCLMQSLRSRT